MVDALVSTAGALSVIVFLQARIAWGLHRALAAAGLVVVLPLAIGFPVIRQWMTDAMGWPEPQEVVVDVDLMTRSLYAGAGIAVALIAAAILISVSRRAAMNAVLNEE